MRSDQGHAIIRELVGELPAIDELARRIPLDVASGANPTTDLDAALDRELASICRRLLPVDVLSEEGSHATLETDLIWIIDPLDGTLNAITGCPDIAVSIALADRKTLRSIVALVHLPLLKLTYSAVAGNGVFVNGRLVERVDQGARRRLIGIGVPGEAPRLHDRFGGWVHELITAGWTCRQSGSAALDLAWAAAGHWLAFWECGVSIWDIAAGDLLAREAGLRTGWQESQIEVLSELGRIDYLAADPSVAAELSTLLGVNVD